MKIKNTIQDEIELLQEQVEGLKEKDILVRLEVILGQIEIRIGDKIRVTHELFEQGDKNSTLIPWEIWGFRPNEIGTVEHVKDFGDGDIQFFVSPDAEHSRGIWVSLILMLEMRQNYLNSLSKVKRKDYG